AGYSSVEATRLEELRALHVQWLENDPSNITGRKAQMEEHVRKAQVFRDVAGLTGILYAFVTRVRNETDSSSAEREVKKLIEKVDEPYHFIYDAAGSLRSGDAKLWRRPSTHFIYDQAKALLSEACIEVREENTGWGKWIRWQVARIFGCAIVISRESGESALKFYFDDLVKVYDHLFKTRYTTEKDRRYLTYQVKLSLYARFPEYLGGEGG
ncbi:MAG: hypothetical protein RMJ86_10805, partial [Anaerolineae bacterium]|nr:hypothetical protein [Anaerolineae bacterium]